jgi:hypothetical protein
MPHPLHDGNRNWGHLNLIFPVYLKLMAGFPSFQEEDVEAGFFHRFGFGYRGVGHYAAHVSSP